MKNYSREVAIERSIMTSFRSRIWSKFTKSIAEYKLIDKDDNIAVCISGGKDSFLLAECMQILEKYGDVPFKCTFMVMNPGYNEINKQKIIENAKIMDIPIVMYDTDIFEIVSSQDKGSPCYLCARMRRGALYRKAKELGCNKIALGHHFDDVIETTLLSMFYGSEIKTMMPKLHSDNFEGIELIRPMYLIKEEDIISWRNFNELTFLNCACRFTEGCSLINDGTSKRLEMKELIKKLRKINKDIDHNIFKSMDNINLNCVLGYVKNKEKHSFLDEYDN